MTRKQYFVRTFIFVFIFYTVTQLVYQFLIGLTTYNVDFVIQTLGIGFGVAAILAGINYFAKFNFFSGKRNE
ncbi:hypothetical protein [Flavobacterium sp.]